MRIAPEYRLPEDKAELRRRAVRLEWATIGFLLSIIVVLYFTLGSSQAMKTAWLEDILSLIPPIAFLVAVRVERKGPDARFPYGRRRAISIAFLCAAVALTAMGLFLIYDSALKLLRAEHPTIGTVELFGRQVWLGWLMMAALVYSVIPPVVLGRMKLPIATALHDKALKADADMNKADWLTGLAAVGGVVGIGFGLWWADAVAALVIATDVAHDGFSNLRRVVDDLMDEVPTDVEDDSVEPVERRLREAMRTLDWVEDADVRLREAGHLLTGELYLVPREEAGLLERSERLREELTRLDWRLNDLVVVPVSTMEKRAPEEPDKETPDVASETHARVDEASEPSRPT